MKKARTSLVRTVGHVGLVVLMAIGGPATTWAADPGSPTPGESNRPWAAGVSKENQDKALELFKDGTSLLKDAFFTRAVEKYREALTSWDHPAIHFNLAKALMNLDQPVEAYNHLEAAMKFGGAPLDAEQIEQVQRYTKLLYEAELAELSVKCTEPGAKVSLNGADLFTAPGNWKGLVRAGKNTIVASAKGFQTLQEQPELPKGQVTEMDLKLTAVETETKYTRVMDAWKPWLVFGAGAAVLAAGGIFSWQASSGFDEYDKAIEVCSASSETPILDDLQRPTGGSTFACVPDKSTQDKKSSAETMQTLSTVSYIVGGVTLATGIVLLYINRERPVKVEVPVEEEESPPVSVLPVIGPDGAGVEATVRF